MGAGTWPKYHPRESAARNGHDARRRKRLKLSLPVHLCPFDPRLCEIEDVGQVVDFTRDGLYFVTCMPHYSLGMRLVVTFPYGDNVSAQRRFLAAIVRIDRHEDEKSGVALRFLL